MQSVVVQIGKKGAYGGFETKLSGCVEEAFMCDTKNIASSSHERFRRLRLTRIALE